MRNLIYAAIFAIAAQASCSGKPTASQSQDISLRDRTGEVAVVYREGFAVSLRYCSELATTYDRYCSTERDPQQMAHLQYRKDLAKSFGIDGDIVALGSADELARVISEVEVDLAKGELSPADREQAKDYLARLTSSRDRFAGELLKILASLDEGVELRLNGSYHQHYDKVLAPFSLDLNLQDGNWWADPETGLVWRKIKDICWFDAMDHQRPNGELCYETIAKSYHAKNHPIYLDGTCREHLSISGRYVRHSLISHSDLQRYSHRFIIEGTFPTKTSPTHEVKKGCARQFGKAWHLADKKQISLAQGVRKNFGNVLSLEGNIIASITSEMDYIKRSQKLDDQISQARQDLAQDDFGFMDIQPGRCRTKAIIADLEVEKEELKLDFQVNPNALTEINLNRFRAASEQEQLQHQIRFLQNFEFDAACVARAEDVDPTGDIDQDGVPNYVDLCNRLPADKTEKIELTGDRLGCAASQSPDPV